jgi:ferredoxin
LSQKLPVDMPALDLEENLMEFRVITEPCIGTKDAACVAICPVNAIHPTKDEADFTTAPQLYVDPDTCIGCGLCDDECPVHAIYRDDDLPPEWKHYAKINADHFRR